MNKSKIEYTDYTYNPITGCLHGCEYCYAKRNIYRFSGDPRENIMAKADYRIEKSDDGTQELYVLDQPMHDGDGLLLYPFGFKPTYHRYRVTKCTLDALSTGRIVFVGAMADIFGEWVPEKWIDEIFQACMDHPQHNYLFLTKNPERYSRLKLPQGYKFWFGTSVTSMSNIARINSLPVGQKRYLSIEPLHGRIANPFIGRVSVDWVIIGAETGKRKGKVKPDFEWIKEIVVAADTAGIPVFMKDSLIPIVGEENMRRDYPQELKSRELAGKLKSKVYDVCHICKKQMKKRDMITLLAKTGRGIPPKQIVMVCPECFRKGCSQYGIEIPQFGTGKAEKHEA